MEISRETEQKFIEGVTLDQAEEETLKALYAAARGGNATAGGKVLAIIERRRKRLAAAQEVEEATGQPSFKVKLFEAAG